MNNLEDESQRSVELKRIKQIAINNNYNPKTVDRIVRKFERAHEVNKDKKDKYVGSITYMGYQTKKIIKCFEKYDVDVAIKKTKTVFDHVKNNNIEEIPILYKSGVYKLSCKDCEKVYVGETGRRFEIRMEEHAKGEGDRMTNSLNARHFMETGHTFINPRDCLLYTSRCV